MVEILCPHCEGEIELEDDASGEFLCPLCDGEFEWNITPAKDWQESSSIEAEERARARILGLKILRTAASSTLFIMGIVMIAMGSIGLAFCQDIWAEMSEPQGDSFSSLGALFILPAILVGYFLSGGTILLGLGFVLSVLMRAGRR